MEQQTQKLLVETQLDITEFDNLLQPIIDTCTKDAISVRFRLHRDHLPTLVESNEEKCLFFFSLFLGVLTCFLFPQAGKNWMFNNAKSAQHCILMTSHLRNRITADGAHFELRLHLIYLTNDVLHHWYTAFDAHVHDIERRTRIRQTFE